MLAVCLCVCWRECVDGCMGVVCCAWMDKWMRAWWAGGVGACVVGVVCLLCV